MFEHLMRECQHGFWRQACGLTRIPGQARPGKTHLKPGASQEALPQIFVQGGTMCLQSRNVAIDEQWEHVRILFQKEQAALLVVECNSINTQGSNIWQGQQVRDWGEREAALVETGLIDCLIGRIVDTDGRANCFPDNMQICLCKAGRARRGEDLLQVCDMVYQ